MRIGEYYTLAKGNLKARKKRTRINEILLVIALSIFIICNVLVEGVSGFINNQIVDSYMARVINVSTSEDYDKIYNYLSDKYSDDERIQSINRSNATYGSISGFGAQRYQVDIIDKAVVPYLEGNKNISLKGNEIIIPKYIIKTTEDALSTLGKIPYQDGDELIGKTVKLNFDVWHNFSVTYPDGSLGMDSELDGSKTYEFTVVGTYDNISMYEGTPYVFVQEEMANTIKNEIQVYDDDVKNLQEKGGNIVFISKSYKYNSEIISDINKDMGNSDLVEKTEENEEYHDSMMAGNASSQAYVDENLIRFISLVQLIGNVVSIVIFGWTLYSIVSMYIEDISKRKKEYGILKAVGYSSKHLSGIMFAETLIISIKAVIISFLLGLIVIIGGNCFVEYNMNYLWQSLELSFSPLILIGTIIVGIGAPLISYWCGMKKVTEINPIEALKCND